MNTLLKKNLRPVLNCKAHTFRVVNTDMGHIGVAADVVVVQHGGSPAGLKFPDPGIQQGNTALEVGMVGLNAALHLCGGDPMQGARWYLSYTTPSGSEPWRSPSISGCPISGKIPALFVSIASNSRPGTEERFC